MTTHLPTSATTRATREIPWRAALQTTRHWVDRLRHEDDGQDLVEYALLAGLVGLGAAAGFTAWRDAIASSYSAWDTNQQNLAVPPPPGG